MDIKVYEPRQVAFLYIILYTAKDIQAQHNPPISDSFGLVLIDESGSESLPPQAMDERLSDHEHVE